MDRKSCGTVGVTRASNAMAERTYEELIGSIRRDHVDHIVVFGAQHLRPIAEILRELLRSADEPVVDQDAPLSRPAQALGRIFPHRSSADCTTRIERSAALV
jgi:hypothetical protein